MDRLAGALAFGVEGYLFYNHVHGRSPLDTKIHLLITLVCVSTALVWIVTFFMENKRKIFILDIIISILVFAQGTWFWHVSSIVLQMIEYGTLFSRIYVFVQNYNNLRYTNGCRLIKYP